jgi:hypothetical protein
MPFLRNVHIWGIIIVTLVKRGWNGRMWEGITETCLFLFSDYKAYAWCIIIIYMADLVEFCCRV